MSVWTDIVLAVGYGTMGTVALVFALLIIGGRKMKRSKP